MTRERWLRSGGGMLLVCILLLIPDASSAADDPPKEEPRSAIARIDSVAGTVLTHTSKQPAWRVAASKSEAFSSDTYLALPGCHGLLVRKDIELTLWGNVPEFSEVPLFESEVVLHSSSAVDLDLTLHRGRIVLTSIGKGPAVARIRFRNKIYDIHLVEKGDRVAVELYGRWPLGVPFSMNPRLRRGPQSLLQVLSLKGKPNLKIGADQYLMAAPSRFQWDSYGEPDQLPRRLKTLPAWASGLPETPAAKELETAILRLQKRLAGGTVDKVLAAEVASDDAASRKLAVYCFAAIDDPARLAEALVDPKFADVRAAAILALHQWMGQAPDNDLRLYRYLVKELKYSTTQSETVLHLLHGLRDADRDRAETYETLIEYLRHPQRSVRELARWQLYRWALAGKNITYDAAGTPQDLDRAYKAWKALVPSGKLPPRPEK